MAIKKIHVNVSYWNLSTGLTGQNLTQDNANKFGRLQTKFRKKGYGKLSKMKCYYAARTGARTVKAEYGTRICSVSPAMFEMILTGLDQWLDGKNNIEVEFSAFGIDSPADLACDVQR